MGIKPGIAQQAAAGSSGPDKAASELPAAPAPAETAPIDLRPTNRDFSRPFATWIGDPINVYRPTTIGKASFTNSVRLTDLVKNGKIYLSLSDAIALAIENNYDIAIARYDLDIADTDILRTRTGSAPLGVPTAIVSNTLTGTPQSASTVGGGPGGTSSGSGGAGTGLNGLTLTTAGAGLSPENFDPSVTGTIQFERATSPQVNTLFSGGPEGADRLPIPTNITSPSTRALLPAQIWRCRFRIRESPPIIRFRTTART